MEDLKRCPYCKGETKVVEFDDGSGHIECTQCYESFESFKMWGLTKQDAINRFNKHIGK